LLLWNRKLNSFLFAFYKANVSETQTETHLVKVKQEGEEVEMSDHLDRTISLWSRLIWPNKVEPSALPSVLCRTMQEMLWAKNISSCKGQRTCSKRVQEQSLDDSLSAAALPLEVPFQSQRNIQTLLENDEVEY
jgi:hypothetical protein